ncbi:MAG TPA: LPXTG cell wall anchor domain-containing protein [Acidimicrobiia bacterium]|nr:LPXTG cell wall anchor domain-containing protein [Acidimicrobiia bacterium]
MGGTTITAGDTTTTQKVEVLGTDVLPLTGADSDLLALFALALAATGVLMLVAVRKTEE